MFNRYISFSPQYEWYNLTEKQFKAMRQYVMDTYMIEGNFATSESKDPVNYIACRGCNLGTGFYFVVNFNHVSYGDHFMRTRKIYQSYLDCKRIINTMDKIAEEVDKVREENE